MLTFGREIGIQDKDVVCKQCAWTGVGKKLSTGLVWITSLSAYLCVYRCPVCDSPKVGYRGTVLPFRFRSRTDQGQYEIPPPNLADDLK